MIMSQRTIKLHQQEEKRDFTLFFDGATAGGNPGQGGCGAVCYRDDEEIFRVGSKLGHVTNNAAEYSGLILGLRRLLHDYPISEFSVKICGDSELVLNQITGEYAVRSDALRPYHIIASSLVNKVKRDVDLIHIPREENSIADKIAKDATKMKNISGDYLVFYPSLSYLLDVTVRGNRLIAGNDLGAAARTPEVLFDANTILELYGDAALETLLDPGKTSFVSGRTNFTVLGILREPVHVSLTTENGIREIAIRNAVVVDYLPYEVQLSADHPDLKSALGDDIWKALRPRVQHRFTKSVLPERFKSHPYWGSNTTFIAAGYGI